MKNKDICETIYFNHYFDFPLFQEEDADDAISNVKKLEEFRIPLLMEVSLFYCAANPRDKVPKLEEYNRVNSKLYRLGNIIGGIFKYIPVQFINEYSSILEITVHCILTEINIEPKTIYEEFKSESNKSKIERKASTEQSKQDNWMIMNNSEYEIKLEGLKYSKEKLIEMLIFSFKFGKIEELNQSDEEFLECLFNDMLAYHYNQLLSVFLNISNVIKPSSPKSKTFTVVDHCFVSDFEATPPSRLEKKDLYHLNFSNKRNLLDNQINAEEEKEHQIDNICQRELDINTNNIFNKGIEGDLDIIDNESEQEDDYSTNLSPSSRFSNLEEHNGIDTKIGLQNGLPTLNLSNGASK